MTDCSHKPGFGLVSANWSCSVARPHIRCGTFPTDYKALGFKSFQYRRVALKEGPLLTMAWLDDLVWRLSTLRTPKDFWGRPIQQLGIEPV